MGMGSAPCSRPDRAESGLHRRKASARDALLAFGVCHSRCFCRPCPQSGRTYLKPDQAKCLHYYFYFIDEELGLCYVRVPTWLPCRFSPARALSDATFLPTPGVWAFSAMRG